MNKRDKLVITLSILYPLFLLVVFALASPVSFYIYIVLGIALCVYWAIRFMKGDTSFSNNKSKNTNTVKSEGSKIPSIADELLKWNDLKDKGAITEDEYQKEKARLLNREN